VLIFSVVFATSVPSAPAQEMPDVRQMSGMPLPVGDLEPGTVVVRVVKGSLANVIPNQTVELRGPAAPTSATTDDTGRAEFKAVASGTRVRAVAIVDGERLESQEFAVPAAGGIRLLLVATDPELEKRAAEDRKLAEAPAQPGIVVLGQESRFVFELGDEGLNVFTIMQILNTARTPVQTPEPLVFDLPDGAQHPALLDGSSPQASVAGKNVTVTGPFAPGMTLVQFAYTVPYSGSSVTVQQNLPAALTQLTVLAQKVGDVHLGSPQMAEHREMPSDGQSYIVGQGPALKAGDVVTFELTGLPNEPSWPRNLALAVAVFILIAGAWASMRTSRAVSATDAARRKLQAKRERLFSELTALEEQHRAERIEPQRYAARRRELIAALERVYAALDEDAAA
jgi:hypothetical protein